MKTKDWTEVLRILKELVVFLRSTQNDEYRARAFERVLPGLGKVTHPREAQAVKGVGPGIMKRICEIWKTGELKELLPVPFKEIRMSPLLREHLVRRRITTIPVLKKAIEKAEVDVPHRIKILVKYYGLLEAPIKRVEVESFVKSLKVPSDVDSLTVCGSFRRGRLYVNDIDLLLIHRSRGPGSGFLGSFVALQEGTIVDHLTPHLDTLRTKYMGIAKLPSGGFVRLDIRHVSKNSRGSALLYFTGPSRLNEQMRKIAKDKGLHLNEYGLWDRTKRARVASTEKEIFHSLGLPYQEPEDRKPLGGLRRVKAVT